MSNRFFRHETGRNYIEALLDLRLRYAWRLLKESDKTVTEVSYDCGFTNLANFNRQFRRHFRMTPKEYHKRWAEEELPSFTEKRAQKNPRARIAKSQLFALLHVKSIGITIGSLGPSGIRAENLGGQQAIYEGNSWSFQAGVVSKYHSISRDVFFGRVSVFVPFCEAFYFD
jgi:hypothetical protein